MRFRESSKANTVSSVLVGGAALASLLNFLLVQLNRFTPAALLALIPIGMLAYMTYWLYSNLNTDIKRGLTLFQIYFIMIPLCAALQSWNANIIYVRRILPINLLLPLFEAAILFFPAILSIHIFKSEIKTRPLKIILIVEIILFAIANISTAVRAAMYGAAYAAMTPTFPTIPVLLVYTALFMIAKDIEDENISIPIDLAKESIARNVIYTIITFGIYGYVWMYRISRKIKSLNCDISSSAGEMMCLLFVPFYSLYWIYTKAKALNQQAGKRNTPISDNSVLYFVLTLLGLNIVSVSLLQNDLNAVIGGRNVITHEPENPNRLMQSEATDIEKLEQLASLLEKGIITDEEYQDKKKEILARI